MSLRERDRDRERDVTASFGLSTQTQDTGHCYKCFYVYVYIFMWVCLSKYVLQNEVCMYVFVSYVCIMRKLCVCMYYNNRYMWG